MAKLIDLDDIHLLGLQTYGSPVSGDFAALWPRLFESLSEGSPVATPMESFGLGSYPADFVDVGRWFYMAGTRVSGPCDTSGALIYKKIPAQRYACFEYRGAISPALGEFFQTIYRQLLPEAGLSPAAPFDLERYDQRFLGPDNEESVLDILIPVRPKGAV